MSNTQYIRELLRISFGRDLEILGDELLDAIIDKAAKGEKYDDLFDLEPSNVQMNMTEIVTIVGTLVGIILGIIQIIDAISKFRKKDEHISVDLIYNQVLALQLQNATSIDESKIKMLILNVLGDRKAI
jgi:hypothetical protein